MNHRSLAFRLAVWYMLLFSAAFALLGGGLYLGLHQYLSSSLTDSLSRRSLQVEQILQGAPVNVSDAQIADAIETRIAPEFNDRFVRVTHAAGGVAGAMIYRSGRPADHSFDPRSVGSFSGAWPAHQTLQRIATNDGPLMLSATPLQTRSGTYLVEVGTSLQPIVSLQQRLISLLGMVLAVLIAFAAGGAYLLVQKALRPVQHMAQLAARISVQDLDERLPVVGTGDALQQLSVALNHMLGRLRDSVQTSRRFLADASHELRTPLTVIKGQLQEVVRDEQDAATMRERIGSTLEEVARLEALVSGLLALSRLDAGDAQREWIDLDLGELAASTAEQMRLVAEDRGVQLDAARLQPLVVRGDRSRLKQVIVNLLDNAIKFTPRGGRVSLYTGQEGGGPLLEIRDTGIGIAAQALPHVFERFFRADEARSRDEGGPGGAGLGLSIVQSICTAHGTRIEVDSRPGAGSRFRLSFPAVAGLPAGTPAVAPTTSPAAAARAATRASGLAAMGPAAAGIAAPGTPAAATHAPVSFPTFTPHTDR